MASSKDYLTFVLGQLSALDGITYRAMMGEYVLYYQGKVIGGIYDDRFLLKPTASAKALMPDAPLEIPYDGAKGMLLADIDNRELMARVFRRSPPTSPHRRRNEKDCHGAPYGNRVRFWLCPFAPKDIKNRLDTRVYRRSFL